MSVVADTDMSSLPNGGKRLVSLCSEDQKGWPLNVLLCNLTD
jgi:hypothetical protein